MNELGRIRLRRHDTTGAIKHFISAARTTPGEHIYSRNIDVVIVRSVSRMIYVFVLVAMVLLWIPAVTPTGRLPFAIGFGMLAVPPWRSSWSWWRGCQARRGCWPAGRCSAAGCRRARRGLRRRSGGVRRGRVRAVATRCRRRCRSRSSSRSWPGSSPPPGCARRSARTRQATGRAPPSRSRPPASPSRARASRARARRGRALAGRAPCAPRFLLLSHGRGGDPPCAAWSPRLSPPAGVTVGQMRGPAGMARQNIQICPLMPGHRFGFFRDRGSDTADRERFVFR